MKHVAFLQDSTCLTIFVIWYSKHYCVIGSVVTHHPATTNDASSRLGKSKGPFALTKNYLRCMCTYIYNRCVYLYVCWNVGKNKRICKSEQQELQNFSFLVRFIPLFFLRAWIKVCKNEWFSFWESTTTLFYQLLKKHMK